MPQTEMIWVNAVLLAALLAVLYFFVLRPDKRARREKEQAQREVKAGDQVSIRAGIHGTVTAVNGDLILIETGKARTELEVLRSAVLPPEESGGKKRIRTISLNREE